MSGHPPADEPGYQVHPAGWDWAPGLPPEPLIDPSRGEPCGEVVLTDPARVAEAVSAARVAGEHWRDVPLQERARLLHALADALESRMAEYSLAEAREGGKPVATAGRSVETAIEGLRLDPSLHPGADRDEDWEPRGVVASILPGNAAIFTAGIRAGAALLAGCTLVFKPPPEASLAVTMLVEDALAVGIPAGTIVSIPGGAAVGAALTDAGADMISFTGSRTVGLKVAAAAGASGVPARLELGGGAPVIVLAGADVDAAAGGLLWGAFGGQGQICVAAKVIRVHRSLHGEFRDRLAALADGLVIGPADDAGTQFGPLHTPQRLAAVEQAVAGLGGVVTGGGRPDVPGLPPGGYYFAPTVVDGEPPPDAGEIFGPVVFVAPYDDVEEALARTNDTMAGLAAGVWGPAAEAEQVARRLRTGQVYVNRHFNPNSGSRPAEPWGRSGFGRHDVVDHLQRRRFYRG